MAGDPAPPFVAFALAPASIPQAAAPNPEPVTSYQLRVTSYELGATRYPLPVRLSEVLGVIPNIIYWRKQSGGDIGLEQGWLF